jgi:hypothetical protein
VEDFDSGGRIVEEIEINDGERRREIRDRI